MDAHDNTQPNALTPMASHPGEEAASHLDHGFPEPQTEVPVTSEEAKVTIPTLSAAPSEEDKEMWRQSAASAQAEAVACQSMHDDGVHTSIAMIYIDWLLNGGRDSDGYFRAIMERKGLSAGGSIKRFALATTANLGLTIRSGGSGEAAQIKSAKNQLQETASALEGLDSEIAKSGSEGSAIAIAYDLSSVKALKALIKEKGGRTGLARIGRAVASVDVDEDIAVIDLDNVAARSIASGRVQQFVSALAYDRLVLAGNKDGALVELNDIHVDPSELLDLLGTAVPASPKLAMIHELGQLTDAIAREPTEKLVDRTADPKSPGAKRRVTNAHIVAKPDGAVVISPIYSEGGVVIHGRPV